MGFISNVKAWNDVQDEDQIKRVSHEDECWDSRVEKQLKNRISCVISYTLEMAVAPKARYFTL